MTEGGTEVEENWHVATVYSGKVQGGITSVPAFRKQ
jgi:hypothetical protein